MSQSKAPKSAPTATAKPTIWAAEWLRWLGLFGLCALAYWPSLRGGFLWDDNAHVTQPELQSLAGLARIWFEPGATQQYYPILHSVFWFEHHLWGDAAAGYHWLNLFLHAVAAGLLVSVLRKLSIPGAWLAGCLFALHPVCVESVAWISEQKNTLSTVFYLLAALAYLRFDQTRAGEKSSTAWRHYALASGWFILAILSKSVTVTLPAALLVVTWWRRGTLSWRRDFVPLLPWFAVGLAAGLCTAWVERHLIGAEGAAYNLDALQRAVLAGRIVWFYLGRLWWPVELIFVYPRWQVDATDLWQWAAPLGVLGALIGLWLLRRRTRGPMAGALFFVGTLFPALGFFNIFPFIYSYVADHFQYLAALGVIVPAAAGLTVALTKFPVVPTWVCRAAPATLIGALGLLTWNQAHLYRDNVTLYRATLKHNPSCWMAAYNLGLEQAAQGQPDAAISSYEHALRLRPDYAEVHANFAMTLAAQPERRGEAIAHLETALRLKPELWQAHLNLANLLIPVPTRQEEAIRHYKEVLRVKPDLAEVRFNLGLILLNFQNRQPEAIAHFEAALRLSPALWQAHYALGNLLLSSPARRDEAVKHLEAALRLKPELEQVRQILGQLRR